MNCFQAKAGQLTPQWYVIDATDMVVGRLAAQIAPILMGKHRPTYTPHIDTGDFVIVTNVEKVVFTGNKWQQKSYQRYSGHPGGQKEEVAWKLHKRRPERILELAIQRMMPKNKIGRHMQAKLKLYVGPQHPHQAQAPIPLTPLSGRPESAGALWTPAPTPKAPRRPKTSANGAAVAPSAPALESTAPAPLAPETEAPTPAVETPPTPAPAFDLPTPTPGVDVPTLEPVAVSSPIGSLAPGVEPTAIDAPVPEPESPPQLEAGPGRSVVEAATEPVLPAVPVASPGPPEASPPEAQASDSGAPPQLGAGPGRSVVEAATEPGLPAVPVASPPGPPEGSPPETH